ncbi:hypothetical protein V2O64_15185 [Verrucomicrobiaceae bacterium 227]
MLEWHLTTAREQKASAGAKVSSRKVIYVTDVKIGNDNAKYPDITP